jgi:transposase InsO family protein
MSSCARSSAAGRPGWGFADLEQLRLEHDLTVSQFCRAVGLPTRTYYDRRARQRDGHSAVRGPWPTPARDGIRAAVVQLALKYPMWGHRKIAWLARHEHGLHVAEATCLRILREAGLVLPIDYVRERRDLAGARREAFLQLPTRRNRVWQMDFFELETSGGGTWRSGDVVDYATKLVLAGPVTATQTHRDAIASVLAAIEQAETLLGGPLINDLTDPATGEITPVYLVSDNGPCFKAAAFATFIASRPELTHIRTRKKSPQTNGVIERYHGAIKIEQLWRELPADGAEMTSMVQAFRQLYNHVRPHETLADDRPIERYLANPDNTSTATAPTRQSVRIP